MKAKFLKYLLSTLLFVNNVFWVIAHVALLSAVIWLILKYVVDFPVSYVPLTGLIYIFETLARSASTHFRVAPIPVYCYKNFNGHHYLYAASTNEFKKDLHIQAALEGKIKKCSGSRT